MGRLLCLLVGACLLAGSGPAAAAIPLGVVPGPRGERIHPIRTPCDADLGAREAARYAVREARERHGTALARMLQAGPSVRAAEAIVQADAMLATIGIEADAVLVAHGACAAEEVVPRALSAMETVTGLAPPAVAAAAVTPRPVARATPRPTPAPTSRARAATRFRPTPSPRPTPRATPTPRPTPRPTAKPAPTLRIVAPSLTPSPRLYPRPTPTATPRR